MRAGCGEDDDHNRRFLEFQQPPVETKSQVQVYSLVSTVLPVVDIDREPSNQHEDLVKYFLNTMNRALHYRAYQKLCKLSDALHQNSFRHKYHLRLVEYPGVP